MRTKWQSGPGFGDGPAEPLRGNHLYGNVRQAPEKFYPYLSRKITFFCCRTFFPADLASAGLSVESILDSSDKRKKHTSKKKPGPWKWIITIFVMTVVISAAFSFLSNIVLSTSTIIAALIVLLIIVFIGILFDIIGVAVTAADEETFHGMASRRVRGASEAVNLIRNANKVSSVCNDVIGDVCGIVSGSATAVIAARILMGMQTGEFGSTFVPLLLSAMVAALTVSGKAVGKIAAINSATQIVFATGRVIAFFKGIFHPAGKRRGGKRR